MTAYSKQALDWGISPFRVHLAEYLHAKYMPSSDNEALFWLLLHIAVQAGAGHIRTDLNHIAIEASTWIPDGEKLATLLETSIPSLIPTILKQGLATQLPTDNTTVDSLPIPRSPLILSANQQYLYFLRRRREEDYLLTMLEERTNTPRAVYINNSEDPSETLYSMLSSNQRLILLSGGPGTGKTTTITRLLQKISPSVRVKLTAPTGRAASRLAESIPNLTGETLHRMLGIAPNFPVRRGQNNPIPADLVIVDEASMMDLPMLNTLLRALSSKATLLLCGDPDQLPSIEAGTVFGDLVTGNQMIAKTTAIGPLSNAILTLNKVHRSTEAIISMANAIRTGNLNQLLATVDGQSITLKSLGKMEEIANIIATSYQQQAGELETFTCLTPLRQGTWGTIDMNTRISYIIGGKTQPFPGMPIVITRNDDSRKLWNGDRAIIKKNGANLQAVFPGSHTIPTRKLPLAILPSWEPAWVQTVHKSQGSEFNTVTLILPKEANKLLTREILYTAITRAKHKINIFADRETLQQALQNRTIRHSRIQEWAANPSQRHQI